MKSLKKALSFLLCVALLLGCGLVPAVAEGAAAEGTFSFLNFNVAGLPSLTASSEKAARQKLLGQKVGADGYDIVAVQEDFGYDGDFAAGLGMPYRTYGPQSAAFGDGLNVFSKTAVYNVAREGWNKKGGMLWEGDIVSQKGVMLAVVELAPGSECEGTLLGVVSGQPDIYRGSEKVPETAWLDYETKLEGVYPCNIPQQQPEIEPYVYEGGMIAAPAVKCAKPRALIPVFPGTNCEYDTARAFLKAGAEPEIMVIRNLSAQAVADSVAAFAEAVDRSQIVFIPGGFSGGDEPDGSGKFITAFFRNPLLRDKVHELLNERDGLMGGICNGFQALVKLGLVPYGEIREADDCVETTLTFNDIGRHQSRLVRTRVASNKSPWLMHTRVGDVHIAPISHGEGKFIASDAVIARLASGGQIATQYCDLKGNPTMDILCNPNGSCAAIEGITSPDGRVFGKMAHSERVGFNVPLYVNVPGDYDNGMFRGAVDYYK